MKKKKKIVILEFLILITIIISLGTVIWLTYSYFTNQVEKSTSNEIQDYSYNKITLYEENIDTLKIYNVPYLENVNLEESSYKIFIKSTDNYINGYTELINLFYTEPEPEEDEELEEPVPDVEEITFEPVDQKRLKSFCNSFNLIEHGYKLTCKYKENYIYIRNDVTLPVELIKESKRPILFEYNQKLSDYLKKLDERDIKYQVVNEIK